jgi:6-pyruvoyltetrahydropterin/6-carboxytetrahydropterin synthase
MYRISKHFSFSAAHHLAGLPAEHPCSRLHGHNYELVLHLRSPEVDACGFVYDYRALQFVKDFIRDNVDHRCLNDCLPFQPTAENLAKYFYDTFHGQLPQLFAVEICETPKTSAIYEP